MALRQFLKLASSAARSQAQQRGLMTVGTSSPPVPPSLISFPPSRLIIHIHTHTARRGTPALVTAVRQQQALLARPVVGGLSSRNFGNAQVRKGGREGGIGMERRIEMKGITS